MITRRNLFYRPNILPISRPTALKNGMDKATVNSSFLTHLCVGVPVDFDRLRDVHIPAAILKSFLRQLPEPLLTYDLYDHIIRVQCKCSWDQMSMHNILPARCMWSSPQPECWPSVSSTFFCRNYLDMNTKTLRAGCSRANAKNFRPATDPLPVGHGMAKI